MALKNKATSFFILMHLPECHDKTIIEEPNTIITFPSPITVLYIKVNSVKLNLLGGVIEMRKMFNIKQILGKLFLSNIKFVFGRMKQRKLF